MRFGLTWPGASLGLEAESSGATTFSSGEFANHDAYVAVAEMAAHTTTAAVGTAIAYAFARSPFAHAAAARHLHGLVGDRLFLGFGAGAFKINRDWFGVPADRPVARLAEVISVVRACLQAENGERISYAGEFYELNAKVEAPVLGPLEVPLLVGAFNEGLLRAGGRVADGIIGHNLFTSRWWEEVVRPAVAVGRQQAGRSGDSVEHGLLLVAIDNDDPQRARRDAKRMIAFYLTVRPYDSLIRLHGWQDAAERSRAAFARGEFDAAAAAVTDEMLDAIGFAGTTQQVAAILGERGDGLPRDVAFLAPPSFLVDRRRREAYARASIGAIAALS